MDSRKMFVFALFTALSLTSAPVFADDDDEQREDLPCQVAHEVTKSLDKAADHVPAFIRPQVKDAVRQAEEYRSKSCRQPRGTAGRAY